MPNGERQHTQLQVVVQIDSGGRTGFNRFRMSNVWIVLHHANACQVSSVALFLLFRELSHVLHAEDPAAHKQVRLQWLESQL